VSFGLSVLGSINLDLIVQTKQLPRAGETVTGGVYNALPGGKGANVAVAAKRLGAETELIAAVGKDDYAAQALVNLESLGSRREPDFRRQRRECRTDSGGCTNAMQRCPHHAIRNSYLRH